MAGCEVGGVMGDRYSDRSINRSICGCIDRLWVAKSINSLDMYINCLLVCCTVYSGRRLPTFQRCLLHPSSGRFWTSTRLHGATSQKTVIFILAAVRIWNLTNFFGHALHIFRELKSGILARKHTASCNSFMILLKLILCSSCFCSCIVKPSLEGTFSCYKFLPRI
jgi:hypothetical protein